MENLFDVEKTPLKIDKPIRLIELFAGIGSQAKALQRLGVNFEHYKISEWEVNATASYKAIHKTEKIGNAEVNSLVPTGTSGSSQNPDFKYTLSQNPKYVKCSDSVDIDYSKNFTPEELTEILHNIGISTDGKKTLALKEIARKNEKWKRTVYNNFKATNNIGSILNVTGKDLGIVDTDKYYYILTYSFPCQDLSLAGKQKGMAKGENTRSGLLWEVERLINECTELPQILLMENVTQVHGKKNKEQFDEWIAFLESKGYSNYWKDLNAKNFGIPQNRNRTFMVSILGDYTYEFPEEFPLDLRLKDMLEDSVDEKFYISNEQMQKIVNWKAQQKPFERVLGRESISQTLTARGAGENHSGMIVYSPENENTTNMQEKVKKMTEIIEPFIGVIGNYYPSGHDASRIVDTEGLAPTVKENHGTVTAIAEPVLCEQISNEIHVKVANKKGYDEAVDGDSINLEQPNSKTRRGRVGHGVAQTLNTAPQQAVVESLRIRKLTPKECWRLMGFDDADFEKAAQVNSNTQLYKQAGNSIVVNVLCYIFRNMLEGITND